ncbi:MAG: dihydrodipicolinate synthase family protein [Rhodoglobus sp.]
MSLTLLNLDGTLSRAELNPAPSFVRPRAPLASRVAYAAAHVVPRVSAENVPGAPADIDWDATLAFRHHVWSWGLGVADAMDTAQRNMGLDWTACAELIRRSAAEAASVGGALVVGVNTDHVVDQVISLDEVIAAYLEQLHVAEDAGADVVLMASRHLARAAESAADYERVYREVLSRAGRPVVLHWLGDAFDASLAGYFGSTDIPTASATVLRIIEDNIQAVRGIKMSLLNAQSEIDVRRELPEGATLFTGDDFNYVSLIEGDELGHSDALLGAFAAVAPSASAAISALDVGNVERYREILAPTEALSRQIFAAPTQYYKTGVAFMSWLNGHQKSFSMVGGLHSARSLVHVSEIVRLANVAHALERPELAAARWHGMLAGNGIV